MAETVAIAQLHKGSLGKLHSPRPNATVAFSMKPSAVPLAFSLVLVHLFFVLSIAPFILVF